MQAFFEAQQHHIDKWLTNPQIYLLAAALLLVSRFIPAASDSDRLAPSVAIDYFYGVVYSLLLFPFYVVFFTWIEGVLNGMLPWINLGLAAYLPAWAQILLAILVNDFLAYVSHYCRHRYRFLWHFHSLHHSQRSLNPFTTKRTHPVERIFTRLFIFWLPLAIIGSPPELWAIYVLVDAAWDYFIHSNLRIDLGPLRWLFVSPQYHRVHHSSLPQHADRNFSDRFVIWDLMFGTAYMQKGEYPPVGLYQGDEFPQEQSLSPWHLLKTYLAQMWYPFRMIHGDFRRSRPSEISSSD